MVTTATATNLHSGSHWTEPIPHPLKVFADTLLQSGPGGAVFHNFTSGRSTTSYASVAMRVRYGLASVGCMSAR